MGRPGQEVAKSSPNGCRKDKSRRADSAEAADAARNEAAKNYGEEVRTTARSRTEDANFAKHFGQGGPHEPERSLSQKVSDARTPRDSTQTLNLNPEALK